MVLHGIGTLIPWNMFITAKSYFVNYKISSNYTGQENTYAANFYDHIMLAAQIPNVLFNWLNIFVLLGGSLKTRIIWSIVTEVLLFIATVVLALVDTSSIPGTFYVLTIAYVIITNTAGGIYQNSVYGMAASLEYTGAVILGSNICGSFTAVINIIAIAMAPEQRTAAIYYFITALFVLLICFDTYFALPLNKFYRFHEIQSNKEDDSKKQIGPRGTINQRASKFTVLRQCFPQCLNVFLVFFITLTVFPAIYSDVKPIKSEFLYDKEHTDSYFTPVTCFLVFNVFTMIGNLLPSLFMWPSPRFLWIPVVLRFLFWPFFLVCNYVPNKDLGLERHLPVLINNDWIYVAGGILLGLTSGYYSSISMISCPRSVAPENAPTAGMFGAAFLITGIFAGIGCGMVLPRTIQLDLPFLTPNP